MFKSIIKSSGESQTSWARKIGCSRSYLSEILAGHKRPSLEIAARIEQITNGQVMAASWVAPSATDTPAATSGDAA